MYNFIDVNQASEGYVLPSEALKINGEYIENQINGYRTLNVQGREALSPDVVSYQTGIRDGSKLQNKRYPERIITVTYQLSAESNEAFREAYNKLAHILDVKEAELIFNDEQDKFFVGTPCVIEGVTPGTNHVVGEFEILCTDPFKYSVIEYEAEPDLDAGSILIDYNGTYKAFPTLEADFYSETDVAEDGETAVALTGNGDCGYVAFFTEDEKIVQLGDPDEVDGESGVFAKSQTLMNQLFTGEYAWGSTAKALWAVNAASGLPTDVQQGGDVTIGIASYAVPASPATTSGTLLKASSTASSPKINYTVTAKAYDRTETSVKVTFTVTASLGSDSSYFGKGYRLVSQVYVNGGWRPIPLRTETDYWEGRTAHAKNMTLYVDGLSASTSSLTGIKFKVERLDGLGQAGVLAETACADLPISTYTASVPDVYYLTPESYGTASGVWHGPTITRTLSADASGEVGATDFTLTYKQKMCIGTGNNAASQMGAFQMQISDASGANIAGVRVHKNTAGNKASMLFYVNGEKVFGTMVNISNNSSVFVDNSSHTPSSSVVKSGNKITFSVAGTKKTFTVDAVADMAAAKVTFAFEQYSTASALSYNGLYWAKFVKNNCETTKDIPNKFSANDVVVADCRSGEILLNGISSPDLGALGNDWEEFCLTPGLNQIGVAFSDWVEEGYEPKFKVRYREVFL